MKYYRISWLMDGRIILDISDFDCIKETDCFYVIKNPWGKEERRAKRSASDALYPSREQAVIALIEKAELHVKRKQQQLAEAQELLAKAMALKLK